MGSCSVHVEVEMDERHGHKRSRERVVFGGGKEVLRHDVQKALVWSWGELIGSGK